MDHISNIIIYSMIALASGTLGNELLQAQPISKDPTNPHYLHYKGSPVLLITSAEHYGAILNLDFDYKVYLQTMADEGMNYTRIFTGSYVEVAGSFGIANNTLSPEAGRFLAPWSRTTEPSLYENEGKFDLGQWDSEYFKRLHDFMIMAGKLDIIVEVTFFCATYQDAYWIRHPFNPGNNVNGLGDLTRQEFNTLKNEKVVKYQQDLVRKLTQELNPYDHVFFEICNEPWADNGVDVTFLHKTLIPPENSLGWLLWASSAAPRTLAWQREIARTFVEGEKDLPKRHLLAQNYSNFKESITVVEDNIDILNFHYAWPESVTQNYGWNRPVNFDESGFAGSHDTTYLRQAWAFMCSGGAIFNSLDYSFYPGKENGSGSNEAPGGGSPSLRRQLKFLSEFLNSFEFVRMKPSEHLILHSPGMVSYCLVDPGKSYAIYCEGRNQGLLDLDLLVGSYELKIYSPDDGHLLLEENIEHVGGKIALTIPTHSRIAISLQKI
ncbi:MAG: hypothetical protein IPL46_32250 [Saprospiraceae bacterium]|nr:hypothetical protein [Saprospiraceae bacterium]